ncbi:MAG: type II toxin-antitoxin system RelE/ParE family toxin [Lachnospiraceae bacterium]|nr:type II toxin-antitoxin system RelE/ParE family toxin [Lachnospiraceae bacterium]MDE6962479.1 type II toxin-antitoxin system RelE/ParE family toxin [Lachnospiraceae bacterium]
MDSFDVIISPKALSQLNDYIDYLQYTLLNDQAANNVWQDALETRNRLSKIAGSLKFCINPQLKKNGYRVIHFMRHRYLMLYRIEGSTAYVDAIYHQLQDYEHIFTDELNQ